MTRDKTHINLCVRYDYDTCRTQKKKEKRKKKKEENERKLQVYRENKNAFSVTCVRTSSPDYTPQPTCFATKPIKAPSVVITMS